MTTWHCTYQPDAAHINHSMWHRARATALEKGVDAVLGPLLDKVEHSMRTSLQPEWTSLELEKLYSLLKAATTITRRHMDAALHASAGYVLQGQGDRA